MACKRINITIPEELYQRLKAVSDSEGIKVSTFIQKACENYIKKYEEQ